MNAPRDFGLQRERTRLNWIRTMLGMVVVIVLVARVGLQHSMRLSLVYLVAAGLATICATITALKRYEQLNHVKPAPMAQRHALLLAVMVLGIAVTVVMLVLAS